MRSRCWKDVRTLVVRTIIFSFLFQVNGGVLHARQVMPEKRKITLDYGRDKTLKPFIASIVKKGDVVSRELRYCHEELQRGKREVGAEYVLGALVDIVYHMYASADRVTRSISTDDQLLSMSDHDKDFLSALKCLPMLKAKLDALSQDKRFSRAQEAKKLSKTLMELLNEVPVADFEQMLSRLITLDDFDGIRQVSLKLVSSNNIIESKVDDINLDLEQCCTTVNSKLDVLSGSTDDCCFTVNSKLDEILCWAFTPITGPTTITASGPYCLCDDITNAGTVITISSSNVILDLRGHEIRSTAGHGVQVTAGISGVTVQNGALQGAAPSPDNGVDLSASGITNVTLKDLVLKGWDKGINATSVEKLRIEDVNINDSVSQGVLISTCDTVDIQNSLFANNGGKGLEISGSSYFDIRETSFNQNSQEGVFVNNGSYGEFVDCFASGNIQHGFSVNSGGSVLFRQCFASDNSGDDGFRGENVTDLNIIACVAKTNGNGFNMLGATSGLLRDNTATNNTTNGFWRQNPSTAKFYQNVACMNGTNYVGVTSAQVTSAENARGVDNVDCADATLDLVEVIDSKVDEIAGDFRETWTALEAHHTTIGIKVDVVNAEVAVLQASLDDCCFTINSKVDGLFEDFTETWTILGDAYDLSHDFGSVIDSVSVIDELDMSVIGWLKTIVRELRGGFYGF